MFTRCAILVPDGVDPDVAVAAARAVVAPGGRIALVGWHRPRFWHIGDIWSALDRDVAGAEDALSHRAAALRAEGFDATAALHLADDAPTAAVPADAELVVVPAEPLSDAARSWTEELLDADRVVAWARGLAPPLAAAGSVHAVVAYVGSARRALPAVAELRRRAVGGERLTLLGVALDAAPTAAPAEMADLLGWDGPVEMAALSGGVTGLVGALDRWLVDHDAHLLAVPVPPAGIGRALLLRALAGLLRPMPVLLVPDREDAGAITLDAPDIAPLGERVVARLDALDPFGATRRLEGRSVSVVFAGEAIAERPVRDGIAELPPLPPGPSTVGFAPPGEAIARIEAAVRLLAPGGRIALLDAEAPVDPPAFAPLPGEPADARRWWAVRLDPTVPCRALRARLARFPIGGLIDAGAVLGDGDPDDLPAAARSLRLARVARRLRAAGYGVDLVLGPSPVAGAASSPVERWASLDLPARARRIASAWHPPPDPTDAIGVMRALTDAIPTSATRLHVELDNAVARRRLIEVIDGARHAIHLQTYIFEPDAIGHALVDALLRAVERGVAVRVLVDALFSMHGALGQKNPALSRLEETADGRRAELRVIRPFAVPGLDDLKRRDHRKLMVVDDTLGWITGRNVGAPYYTAFDEVALGPDSPYRDVPWLDAGAEVEGPVVAALAEAFARHWRAAGGQSLPTPDPGPAGPIAGWLVQHESMRDTRTLDAYRHLIERAAERITIVNTFPLQFELQQVLQAALARGVAVRFLVGHVRPLFGPERTPFRGGAIRSLATEVIHGRLDALIAAGAEARGFALRDVPGWDAALGTVLPHVHAKLVTVDGRRFAIGSANLDITAGYWESEALLIVDDAAETAALDRRLDGLLAEAVPIDADPRWAATAARRTWVSRHWPSLLG